MTFKQSRMTHSEANLVSGRRSSLSSRLGESWRAAVRSADAANIVIRMLSKIHVPCAVK